MSPDNVRISVSMMFSFYDAVRHRPKEVPDVLRAGTGLRGTPFYIDLQLFIFFQEFGGPIKTPFRNERVACRNGGGNQASACSLYSSILR